MIADPHRPGHELSYHPGETNLRMADVVIINKVDTADYSDVISVQKNIRTVNNQTIIVKAASPIMVDDPTEISGKRVLVVEDGPTLTHGGMSCEAGVVAADYFGASEIVDPRPFAVRTIADTFAKYPDTGKVLPAMGYGEEQIADLEETINNADADLVIIATPIDLGQLVKMNKPSQRVRYSLQEIGQPSLSEILRAKFEPTTG